MPAVDHFPSTHGTWLEQQLTVIDETSPAASAGDAAACGRSTLKPTRDLPISTRPRLPDVAYGSRATRNPTLLNVNPGVL